MVKTRLNADQLRSKYKELHKALADLADTVDYTRRQQIQINKLQAELIRVEKALVEHNIERDELARKQIEYNKTFLDIDQRLAHAKVLYLEDIDMMKDVEEVILQNQVQNEREHIQQYAQAMREKIDIIEKSNILAQQTVDGEQRMYHEAVIPPTAFADYTPEEQEQIMQQGQGMQQLFAPPPMQQQQQGTILPVVQPRGMSPYSAAMAGIEEKEAQSDKWQITGDVPSLNEPKAVVDYMVDRIKLVAKKWKDNVQFNEKTGKMEKKQIKKKKKLWNLGVKTLKLNAAVFAGIGVGGLTAGIGMFKKFLDLIGAFGPMLDIVSKLFKSLGLVFNAQLAPILTKFVEIILAPEIMEAIAMLGQAFLSMFEMIFSEENMGLITMLMETFINMFAIIFSPENMALIGQLITMFVLLFTEGLNKIIQSGIIESLVNVFLQLMIAATPLIEPLMSLVMLFANIITAMMPLIITLMPLLQTALYGVGFVIGVIFNIIAGIINAVVGVVNFFGGNLKKVDMMDLGQFGGAGVGGSNITTPTATTTNTNTYQGMGPGMGGAPGYDGRADNSRNVTVNIATVNGGADGISNR